MRRKKLIDDTLQKVDGEVIVTFLLNDVKHIIKRNSKTQEIHLKIGDEDFDTDYRARNQKPFSGAGLQPETVEQCGRPDRGAEAFR